MIKPSLEKVTEVIASDLVRLTQEVINENLGKQHVESRLADSVVAKINLQGDSLVIELLMNNYIDYIENGRKPRTGRMPSINSLRDWALQYGVDTDNDTLYAIAQAIWRDGIAPRPILTKLDEQISEAFDSRWSDLLFEALIADLTKYFNQLT